MKKNKIFAVLTTSALLLAACSNGDNSSSSGQKGDSQKNEQTNSQSEKLKRIMTKTRMRIKSITLKMALKEFMSQAILHKVIRLMN